MKNRLLFVGFFLWICVPLFIGCGAQDNRASDLDIYRGEITRDPQYLTVGWMINGEAFACSGVLIDNQHFLTAGHCLEGRAWDIYFEIDRPRRKSGIGRKYLIKSTQRGADIGIVKLRKPFDLPQEAFFPLASRALKRGENGTVLGYGETENSENAVNPKKYMGEMNFSRISQSGMSRGAAIFNPGPNRQMPCVGDSGGPVITTETRGKKVISALVQGGRGIIGPPRCGSASTNYFVSIYKNRHWILANWKKLSKK